MFLPDQKVPNYKLFYKSLILLQSNLARGQITGTTMKHCARYGIRLFYTPGETRSMSVKCL